MGVSPFPYQGPLEPAQVRGRDDLLANLTAQVTEHKVTALLGPRRFGKTSVLGRLAADLTEVCTVTIDLFGVQTHGDVATRMSEAMRDADAQVRDSALQLSVQAGIDLFGVKVQLAGPPSKRPDERALFERVVETLVGVAQRTPLLVIFDEFQSITAVEGATAVLRTHLQHHYSEMGLIFAGSAPSAMRDVFTRHDQPFFNQADLITVEPLGRPAVHQIVNEGFVATGRDPGGVADQIFGLTQGHPQRTMRAADEVWRHTDPGQRADEHWGQSLISLRHAEASVLAATYEDLSSTEKKVVRICANHQAIFGAAAERLALSPGSATYARDSLLADGKLRKNSDAELVVTDPLLSDWVAQQLPL